jgi:hypothetical protein
MHRQLLKAIQSAPHRRAIAAIALAAMLGPAGVSSQTQQNPNTRTAPPNRPVTTTNAQRSQQPQQQAPASRWHIPFSGNRNTQGTTNQTAGGMNRGGPATPNTPQSHSFFNNLFHRNNNSPAPAGSGSSGVQMPGHPTANSAQRGFSAPGRTATTQGRAGSPANAPIAGGSRAPIATHLASTGPTLGRPVHPQSQAFLGHPGPPGSREVQAQNGNIVRTAADGSVIDVHNPATGMSIHHGLDGGRRITVDQPDGSRVVVPSRGVAYVQHPYLFQAHPYDHRTFYDHGQVSHQFYRPYTYAGATLDVYAPQRFYSPEVYQWATTRYSAPLVPSWNYVTSPSPWFAYYRGYFTPEPAYTSPAFWLTDFVLATSLIAAYNAHPPAAAGQAAAAQPVAPPGAAQLAAAVPAAATPAAATPAAALPTAAVQPATVRAVAPSPAAGSAPEITPEVKEMVADEVTRQIKEESTEARQNAQNKDPPPGAGGIVQELNVREPHVFIVASDLDLVDSTGRRCMMSEADVLQVISGPKTSTATAEAVVLASKGGAECERASQVDIALADLQEMQNHMRETIDQGLANTRTGRSAPTVTPAFAAAAPPPDANAANEIQQQQQIAALTEG